jgi:hypothetical protein
VYYGNAAATGASLVSSTFTGGSFQDLFDGISTIDAQNSSGLTVNGGEVRLMVADTEILDESQTSQNNNWSVYGTRYHAQTFYADITGFLTKVTINTRTIGTPPNALEIQIRNATAANEPGNIIYATARRSDIGATLADYDFTFSVPASVTAGTQYALVIKTDAGDAANYYRTRYQNSDTYSRGRRLISTNGGTSWTGSAEDLYFLTYVSTASELDQSQVGVTGSTPVYGSNWVGQSFLAGDDGALTMIVLRLSATGTPPSALTVELRNAEETIAETLDQSQTAWSATRQVYGSNWEAQTLKAGLSGQLSRITLRAARAGTPPNALVVELRNVVTVSQENLDQNQIASTGTRQVYGNNWSAQIFQAGLSGTLTKIAIRASSTGTPPNALTVELRNVVSSQQETQDQSQLVNNSTWNIQGTNYMAQTFQAGLSGELTRVTLRLLRQGNPPNPIQVEIRDCTVGDLPGSTVLTATSLNASDIGTAFANYDFTFASPATVTAGVKYSIVVKTVGGNNTNRYRIRYRNANVYTNGRMCTSANSGSTWTGTGSDMYFRTYVRSTPYVPGNTVLATASRTGIGALAEYEFTFAAPYAVTAGTDYAIVVRTIGGSATNRYNVAYQNSNVYADGTECSSIDGGSSWTPSDATDLYFRTYVTTLVGNTPGSTVYASASRSDITVAGNYDFTFASPYTVTAGTDYAIVIYTVGGSAVNRYDVSYQNTNAYGLGKEASSTNSGSTWTPSTTSDLYFYSYVRAPTGDWEPGDTVYATASRSGVGTTSLNYEFSFATPYTVSAGTYYAIVIRTTGGSAANCYNVYYQNTDVYSNGNEATSVNAGVNWTNVASDLYFQTYLQVEETIAASGILRSVTIPVSSAARFAVGILLSWNDTEGANSDIKYHLEYYTGAVWQLIPDTDLPGNSAGFDTSGVNISSVLTDYGQIRLRANLSSTYSADTPRIQDWMVTYYYRGYTAPEPSGLLGSEQNKAYLPLGTIASKVYDTGVAGTLWLVLAWSATLPAGASITFEVRASDTAFAKDNTTLPWINVGGACPITSGLPSGRYQQWRATLTSSGDTAVLHEVRALRDVAW